MNQPRTALPFLFRSRHPLALGLGLFLGQAVTLMALREGNSAVGFFVATLFAVSASASFVLFTLSSQPQRGAALSRHVHGLVGLIGLGLLLSLRARDFLA